MRILCVLLFFMLSVVPCSAASAGESPILLVAVDVPYPPFAFVDENGVLTGFDVEIAKALCAELQRTCAILPTPFDDILPDIVQGRIDLGIAGMGATEERKRYVDFTDRYFRSSSIFIEKAGTIPDISPQALKGLRIATQSGTMQEDWLRVRYAESALLTAPSFTEALDMLRQGEADAVLVDGLAGYSYLKSPHGKGLEAVGSPISAPEIIDSSCIAVSKQRPDLREAINKAIQAIRRSGEYGRINRRYFDFNVY